MKRTHFICLIAALALTFLGPATGLMVSTLRMRKAIERLSAEDVNQPDRELATHVRAALRPTIVGMVAGALGLVSAAGVAFLAARARTKEATRTTTPSKREPRPQR